MTRRLRVSLTEATATMALALDDESKHARVSRSNNPMRMLCFIYTALAEVKRYPGLPKESLHSALDVEVRLQTECPIE